MRLMTTEQTTERDATEDYARTAVPPHAKRSARSVASVLLGIVTAFFFPAVGGAYYQSYGAGATLVGLTIGFIILMALVLPVAAAASKQGLTAELISRGCGFGYAGTVLTTIIYGITFIILAAVESQILATAAAQLIPIIPIEIWYVFVGMLFIPLTWYGMKLLPKMMSASLPIYIVLVGAAIILGLVQTNWAEISFSEPSVSGGAIGVIGVLAGLSGIIGLNPFEASDYTRFIPGKKFWRSSWLSVVFPYAIMFFVAYPLGIFFTMVTGGETDPAVYFPLLIGVGFGVLLAWVSQVRINLTSIHIGSIALTSANERLLPWHLGRRFWTAVMCILTILLMFADVLGNILVFLEWNGVFLLAWAGSILADLLIVRKMLRILPEKIEYRESHIRKVNPVGVTSLIAGCTVGSLLLVVGGPILSGLSAYISFTLAAVVHVVMALITKSKYYTRAEIIPEEAKIGIMRK